MEKLRSDNSGNTVSGQSCDETIHDGGGIDTVSGDSPACHTYRQRYHRRRDGDPGDTVDCGPNTDMVEVNAISGPSAPERIEAEIKTCETVRRY